MLPSDKPAAPTPAPAAAPVTPAAPVPGSPEYDAQMAAKYDAAQGVVPPAQRPDNIPEKFWNADKGEVNTEALLKSYIELEKLRGQKPADPAPQPAKAPAEPPAPDAKVADQAVQAAGLDMAALSAKVNDKGSLDDSDYEALSKVGIGKEYVDAYIAGQKALADQFTAKAHSAAGGAEAFASMQAWAGANLSEAEIGAFNAAINGGEAEALLAINGLTARYTAAVGKDPQLIGGGRTGEISGYQSRAEMTRDMADPRYSKDPAYRAAVANKIAATTAF